MSLKLIHFPLTRSLRVAWAVFELGLDVEIETRPYDHAKLKEPEYLALHPLGKTPVLFDDGKRIIESIAIIEYLSKKYANGALSRNPQNADYADYLMWMEFGEAGMGGYAGQLIGHVVLLPEAQRSETMRAWAENELANCFRLLEDNLQGKDYLLGEFSLADISVGYILFLTKLARHGHMMGPNVAGYFHRLTERDAWKQANALKP